MHNERYPLIGANIKLDRATHHIEYVQRLANEFWKSDPYTLKIKRDPSGREYRAHLLDRDAFWNSPAWIDLCCTTGDAIHNLRSALDHVAYAVARKNGLSSKQLKQVQFVIRSSRKEFDDAVNKAYVRNIGSSWVRFLRSKQPYNRRNGLWRLNMLDNIDKHRALLNLSPIASIATQRRGEDWKRYTASFKKGVIAEPIEPDSNFGRFPFVTLANTGRAYGKRKDAFNELLEFRTTIAQIVMDAKGRFFA